MKLTENDVSSASWRNREYAESSIAHAMAYLTDKDKKARMMAQSCAWCFYFCRGMLAGQAFTQWRCRVCDREALHANTATPRVCPDCAQKHLLCVECGADIHLRSRRKATLE